MTRGEACPAISRYGIHALRGAASSGVESGDSQPRHGWAEFSWQGQRHFSWIYAPRIRSLDLYDEEARAPDPDNAAQITFLRIMAVLEKAVGGPIYVGNDVVDSSHPEHRDDREEFCFPTPLDALMPDWRTACAVEPYHFALLAVGMLAEQALSGNAFPSFSRKGGARRRGGSKRNAAGTSHLRMA